MQESSMRDAAELRHLIELFGVSDVWHAGIELLGYPPTWMIGGTEILELGLHLSQKGNGNGTRI